MKNDNYTYFKSDILGKYAMHKETNKIIFENGTEYTKEEWLQIKLVCDVIGGEVVRV